MGEENKIMQLIQYNMTSETHELVNKSIDEFLFLESL